MAFDPPANNRPHTPGEPEVAASHPMSDGPGPILRKIRMMRCKHDSGAGCWAWPC
jgi:hypothetical protein